MSVELYAYFDYSGLLKIHYFVIKVGIFFFINGYSSFFLSLYLMSDKEKNKALLHVRFDVILEKMLAKVLGFQNL